MPIYFYKAKKITGEYISGAKEEKSEKDLARSIRKDGYILISVEKQPGKVEKKIFSFGFFNFLNRVSSIDKIVFTRNLAVLTGAGVSLSKCMEILSKQTKNKRFKKVILDISEKIIKGISFSEALSKHSNVFPEVFSNMIKSGEESGTLEEVLNNLAEQMEKTHELKQKVKGAMAYPIMIVFVVIGIGILMIITVVPSLSETFINLEMELPFTTRVMIKIGETLSTFWYLLVIALFGIPYLIKVLSKSKKGKKAIDNFIFKIPVISGLVKSFNSANVARTLSSLISSGIPIAKSLQIASKTSGNIYYQEALIQASEEIKKGVGLSQSLSKNEKIFSPLIIQMIKVGEETGETSSILKKLADFYENEVANSAKNLSSLIEPVLMLVIGATVGFFAISMIHPIYSMIGSM